MEKTSPDERLDLLPSILVLWKHKYLLLGVTLGMAVLAYVLTLFMTPLYESHVTLLPSNSTSRNKQLEEFSYGYEVHSERLVQLLSSELILDSVEQEFGLAAHYGVDLDEKMGWDQFFSLARERIQFHKTRYSSVVISVQDTEPEMAAAVANRVAELVNVVNAEILKTNARVALEAVERDYEQRLGRVGAINDSIRILQESNVDGAEEVLVGEIEREEQRIKDIRNELDQLRQEYQIFDFGEQVNVLNEELAEARTVHLQETGVYEILKESRPKEDSVLIATRARLVGAEKRVRFFESQLAELSAINNRYLALSDELTARKKILDDDRTALNSIRKSYEPSVLSRNLQSLQAEYDWDLIQVRELRRQYQNALANFLDPVPIAFIASYARPSYRPIYPNTFLTVVLAALGALIFTAVAVSFRTRL